MVVLVGKTDYISATSSKWRGAGGAGGTGSAGQDQARADLTPDLVGQPRVGENLHTRGWGGTGRQGSSLEGGHASRDDLAFLFRPAGLLRHGRVEPAGQPRAKRFQEQGCPITLHPAIPPNAFVISQLPGEPFRINPGLTLFVPAAAGLDLMKTYYLPTSVFN